ncbi:hypothetical protein SLS56_011128 [Neofusicoccum ribis]|uniref:Tat pathway signal sequence n=1 Tax=Neofusicoccum ribis TaxID=45134 RepID=A0ABR3SCW7_9PEZI
MALAHIFEKNDSYRDDEGQENLLTPEGSEPEEFAYRSRRKAFDARRVFFLSSVSLLLVSTGVVLGYWCREQEATLSSFGLNPITPLPIELFSERHDVPFIAHPEFMGPSKEAAKNWARITEGSDSIYVPDHGNYENLKDPGIHAPFFIFNPGPASAQPLSNDFYVLSNLHQLHCTNVIRQRYNMLVCKSGTFDPLAQTAVDEDWITHVEHCFEYLRLSIMCADYMVLEPDSPPGSPEEYAADGLGWGVVHKCIHWDKLIKYQEEQVRLYNSTWS